MVGSLVLDFGARLEINPPESPAELEDMGRVMA